MAKLVFKDASVVVNAVDLSDHVRSVEITFSAEDVESTTMGATGKGRLPGLRDESIVITWAGDFAASKVSATLDPLYTGGTSHTVTVKPTSAAVSATNPSYSATCYLLEMTPLTGEVGSLLEVSSTFVVDGVITRATS